MRVATWNLDHASHSRPVTGQLDRILEINPDIIVLTETYAKVDLASVGYEVLASDLNKYGKNYSAIWSKWPIEQAISTYDPETATCAKVGAPHSSVIVYGTILTWRMDKGLDGKSRQWEEHHKEIVKQGEDWFRIQNEFPGLAFIVAGDFNQTRGDSSAYRSLEGVRLLDEELSRNMLDCLTEEDFGAAGKLKPDPRKGRVRHNIDHICVTRDAFRVEQVGAWDHFTATQELSDHNGVFVDLVPIRIKSGVSS